VAWIEQRWHAARLVADEADQAGAVSVLDEIHKPHGWSEAVKRLWDEDTRERRPLKVVLLGSAPLLITQGLTESLAGRFEVLRLPHWSFGEMHAAFAWSLDEYLYLRRLPGRGTARRRASITGRVDMLRVPQGGRDP
jgi:predicted AAA+ superfamily ATPase